MSQILHRDTNPACTCGQFQASLKPRQAARRLADAARRTIVTWMARRRQLHDLAALDDRLLDDIGLSRADVTKEAKKPFWLG